MTRTVLITGSAGHLGRALRAAFTAAGDKVMGIDAHDAEWICDLEYDCPITLSPDILICNAKLKSWESHHALARETKTAIVNIGSIYALVGNDPGMYSGTEVEPTPAWYAASKGALIALTKWQACNLAPVRSNAVCPGGIYRQHSDEFRLRYEVKVPLGRMATEADIVPLVVFLASDAASYITGQVIAVDGGLTACA